MAEMLSEHGSGIYAGRVESERKSEKVTFKTELTELFERGMTIDQGSIVWARRNLQTLGLFSQIEVCVGR